MLDPPKGYGYYPACSGYNSTVATINFGQRAFAYTAPTGFKALNTKNLKDAGSYNLPDTFGNYVNTPDLVWVKSRSNATNHALYDTVRGPAQTLVSNGTNNSTSEGATALQAFLPNGYRFGADNSGVGSTNNAGYTYVGWAWNRGQTPGLDIVTYRSTVSASVTTVQHNLGVMPAVIMLKEFNATSNWIVWHKYYNTVTNNGLYLNGSSGSFASGSNWLTSLTSNSFSILEGQVTGGNTSTVAYLWAEVPGFSKFGNYTGNGSADGPFVYTGFRPKFVMIKRTDTTSDWFMWDTVRSTYNPVGLELYAEATAAEASSASNPDILSNGFKIRLSNPDRNASGGNYIYMAFAEAPFKYATAR